MSDYSGLRSEIRPSAINALHSKVAKRNYQHYLYRMRLTRLRAYADAEIVFDFPVTALVGPNGGGKTTILGAAAIIHETIKPRQYFAKSGSYDANMADWSIEYELVENGKTYRRTASYPKSKWNRDAVKRPILTFGVSRTLPATERKELSKFIAGNFKGSAETKLTPETIHAVEKILGKNAADYLQVSGTSGSANRIHAARSDAGSYSEFHFGAGEASVIRIVSEIEEAPESSLIAIEEIENGLHPVATRRLVDYLIDVAKRKNCQVIFTTHSNDALKPLPNEAVWACAKGQLTQGKLDVNALRTLTGEIDAQLAIFVEDEFAKMVVEVALRDYCSRKEIPVFGIQVHAVGGEDHVIKLTKSHNKNPSIKFKAVGVLDGDMREKAAPEGLIFALPGDGDPELHILDSIAGRINELSSRLAINLGLRPTDQSRVAEVTLSRKATNRDPHVVFAQIGDDLDYLGETFVGQAFAAQWVQAYTEEVDSLFDQIAPLMAAVRDCKDGSAD
ncbi:ATP-dependent endonuclease [Micrococcus luteus]|uniref:ATP-dependent nuclease n=1 Tax=Micrococcus luteus TaxID=1270 RepID=UPI0035125396